MVTSRAQSATRVTHLLPTRTPTAPLHTDRDLRQNTPAGSGTGLVVRLELPDVDADDQQPTPDHRRSGGPGASKPAIDHRGVDPRGVDALGIDPQRLARAIEDLLHTLAPSLVAQVRVEVAPDPTRAHSAAAEIPVTPPSSDPVGTAKSPPATAFAAATEPPTGTWPGAPAARSTAAPSHPAGEPPTSSGGPDGELPALHLDLAGRTLTMDGRPIGLTRREFELLAYLHHRRGTALSRGELMSTVWQTGYLIGDRTIDVHVRRLRQKLGPHAHRLTTLRGYGYRLD